MADDVTYQSATPATPPSGTVIATDEAGSPARQYQLVKLVDGTANSETPIVGMAAQPAGTEAGLVVRPASAIPDITVSGTIDAADGTVTLELQGRLSASVTVVVGDFVGDFQTEWSADGGSTWDPAIVWSPTAFQPNAVDFGDGMYSFAWLGGGSHVRVRATTYTSGTLTVSLRASMVASTVPGVDLAAGQPGPSSLAVVVREAARGQGTMATSIPVVLPSDQSAVPVSAASLPLPTGASTLAEQQTQTASLSVLDDWDESDRAKVNLIVGQAGIAAGTGIDGATVPRVTLATDVGLPAGTNNIGDVDVLTLPAIPAGNNNIGDVDIASIAAGTNYVGKVRLTDGTLDSSLVDETGSSAVDALAVGGGTPHDSVDSGNPIKLGVKAASAFPTAVAANDRANVIGDLWGRPMVTHIDPAQQVWKSFNATSTQTGVTIWDPTSGKKIAITSIVIGTYGTTAGRAILWFGANGDTTYSAGTDQLVLAFSSAPSASSKPGLVFCPAVPIFCTTADMELHITTDANLSIDVAVAGYEWA